MSDAVTTWAQQAEPFAAALLRARPAQTYAPLLRAFLFFYFRRMLATGGGVTVAGRQAGCHHNKVNRWLTRCPQGLTPATERTLEQVASTLADDGATARQARRAFQEAIFCAAVRAAGGNRAAAARRLGLHRNSLFNPEFKSILAAVDRALLRTGRLQQTKAVA